MTLLVRSFVCCVLAAGARGQSNVTVVYPPPVQTQSVVLIESPALRRAGFQEWYAPARQITYLIAFKDSLVRVADQYWVSGKTLYYVTTDHERMTAPVSSVDRTLSKQLNSERDVAFYLPPEQEKVLAQTHLVRHSARSVRQRCNCVAAPSTSVPSRESGGASRSSSERP
uniref:Uncharacterized protein n=1 Tax=Solibacter usitatus (strain Ellin6076) TaxID=234267 RepID=Q01XG7_SOLUE